MYRICIGYTRRDDARLERRRKPADDSDTCEPHV